MTPHDEASAAPRLARPRAGQIARSLAATALGAALVWWLLPAVTHTSWAEIGGTLAGIHPLRVVALLALMLAGLLAYAVALVASLPGLRLWQGLVVNLAGSATSNLLPGGGAVGVAVSYLMGRSWGLPTAAITTSVAVTTVWNVLGRVALPLGGLLALLGSSRRDDLPGGVVTTAALAAGVALLLVAGFVGFLVSDAVARGLARAAGRLARRDLVPAVLDQKARWREVVAGGWGRMTLGVAGYFGFWFVLLALCLDTVGAPAAGGGGPLGLAEAFAAYAVGRVLTTVPVTPGGLGVTEAGTAAVLIAFGVAPVQASAAVVLFTLSTHVAEIAFGLLAWVVWALAPRARAAPPIAR